MRLLLIASLAALAAPFAVQAQDTLPDPVPIEEWSQDKITAMGREIFIQDTAAWRATDSLLRALSPQDQATIRGWVVLGEGSTRTVRFLKADGDGVAPGWDIVFTDGVGGRPTPAAETVMTGETLARFNARQTAAVNIGTLRCGVYNSVVTRDPDGEGWIAWLLASTTEHGVMPIGGHYRFHISADGQTVIRRDQLSNTCMNVAANPPPGPQGQAVGVVVSQIVSESPVETHVFLSLQFRKPIYVVIIGNDRMYAVEGDRIREVNTRR